jgi:hypothetical protein
MRLLDNLDFCTIEKLVTTYNNSYTLLRDRTATINDTIAARLEENSSDRWKGSGHRPRQGKIPHRHFAQSRFLTHPTHERVLSWTTLYNLVT